MPKSDSPRFSRKTSSTPRAAAPGSASKKTMPLSGEEQDNGEAIRLNKALAAAGICSRRAADALIERGAVSINGERVESPGVRVFPGKDVVAVNGVPVNLHSAEEGFQYIMLNKPARVVTTAKDPQGRTTVLDLLPESMRSARLFPVGRLDFFSEGLLLLTDDGELTYRLTHPKWHLPKVYRLRIRGKVDEAALRTMRSGMTLEEGEHLAPVEVRVVREEQGTTTLEMTLIQGVNRQIRRMCRDLNITVLTLRRLHIGPVSLTGLERGKARVLTSEETLALRQAVGLA